MLVASEHLNKLCICFVLLFEKKLFFLLLLTYII